MKPHWQSVIIALVVPIVLVLAGVLLLGPSSRTVSGVPVLFVFIFAMFPVTTVLMWVSWQTWDRHSAAAFEQDWSRQVITTGPGPEQAGAPAAGFGTGGEPSGDTGGKAER